MGEFLFCKYEPVALAALVGHGAPFTLVLDDWDREFAGVDDAVLAHATRVYDVTDFDSLDELTAVAWDLEANGVTFDRVLSFAEFSQYGAGFLADALGIRGFDSATARGTRDKRAMKALVREAGVLTARSVSVPSPVPDGGADLIESQLGFPLVLKPVNGMGAMLTEMVRDREELVDALARNEVHPPLHSRHRIAESFVDGAEHHVDAVWRDGTAVYFSIGRYAAPRLATPPGFECSVLLAPDDDPELFTAARALHERVNDALGIRDGVTHLELFRRPEDGELVFSEVATRFGGGPLIQMVLARDGVDLRSLWIDTLVGAPPNLADAVAGPRYVAGINIPPEGPGPVTSAPTGAELDADPRVLHHDIGVTVGEEPHGPWTLMLTLGGGSMEEIEAVIGDVQRTYRIRVDG